jgi:hypothetical protein
MTRFNAPLKRKQRSFWMMVAGSVAIALPIAWWGYGNPLLELIVILSQAYAFFLAMRWLYCDWTGKWPNK